jgi:hypothetical protein
MILGRMDSDELALPGYATLSQATKARLAALPKGELLVRHPHFTHPVFIRFPRPAVLSGREGVERFPPRPELPFGDAVARRLRALDRSLSRDRILEVIAGRREDDVRKALNATIRARPEQPLAWFIRALGRDVPTEMVRVRDGVKPVKTSGDLY